jgi:putative transcriptional regulator
MSKTTTTARMRADGTVVEVMSDGSERPFPHTPIRTMTEAEIEVAAAADPDARPITPEELRTARRVPRVKKLRRALGLTQQEFAARYHIFPSARCGIGNRAAWSQTNRRAPTSRSLRAIPKARDGPAKGLDRAKTDLA